MTEKVVSDLREAYMDWCTNAEAALYAGIWLSTLNRYLEENPSFRDKRDQWKQSLNLTARRTIANEIRKEHKKSFDEKKRPVGISKTYDYADRKMQDMQQPDQTGIVSSAMAVWSILRDIWDRKSKTEDKDSE